jgi:transposase InsO family protein
VWPARVSVLIETLPPLRLLLGVTTLPRTLRAAFQDVAGNLTMASGQCVAAKGPVLCDVEVCGRQITEAVYAMDMPDEGILGVPALKELGVKMTLGNVDFLQTAVVRRGGASRVYKIMAAADTTIPSRSESLVKGHVKGNIVGKTFVVESRNLKTPGDVLVARSVSTHTNNIFPLRVYNPSDKDILVRKNQYLANAETAVVIDGCDKLLVNGTDVDANELPEHLKALYKDTCEREQLTETARTDLRLLLVKYADLFAKSDTDFGKTHLVEHDINTGDARPIRQPPRRVPIALQPEMDKEIQRMLDTGVIKPGHSPWSSPVVLVRKKDGKIRFCVDYRRLNSVTVFDSYPLPRVDETIDSLSGARFFTTLDLLSGYWQVPLTEAAKQKSAFTTRSGLWLFQVLPFGLCNAPSCFERLMETVLAGLQWTTCLVYIDDIIIFGKTEKELIDRMDEVFYRLKQAGLKVKPKKCRLFARKVEFLGHVISEAGIAMMPEKVAAIKDWPTPETVSELRSFLGTASYYRRFVRDFATIAAPLHKLTEKYKTWQWTNEQETAFKALKDAISTAPVLKFPVKGAPYILDTDASNYGIGAVLSQMVDGKEMVLGYASRTLSKQEQGYCVTRREMLAVVNYCKHFRPYLFGQPFTIRTDHSSLQWLLSFKEPEGQKVRWLEQLSQYNYTIEHRPGKKHGNADGLSRRPCRQCGRDDEVEGGASVNKIALPHRWTNDELQKAQRDDTELLLIINALESQQRPDPDTTDAWPRAARQLLSDWDRLTLTDRVLRRRWYNEQGNELSQQTIVPRAFVRDVVEMGHNNVVAGHFAERRTRLRIQDQYYWVGMSADIRHWIRACVTCCARRPRPTRPHHLVERQVVSAPMSRVALDICGPLNPPTTAGNRYILVITDYLTKWCDAYPMADMRAETCANLLVKEFICRFGIPEVLHSDQGTQFESDLWHEMCRLLGIRKTRTSPYHPQGDGQSERMMKSLADLLAKTTNENPVDWDLRLPFALAAYRSSVHSATGETPNRLMLGREVITPLTLLAPPAPGQDANVDWVAELHDNFIRAHERAVESLQASHRAARPRELRRQKGYKFNEGDLVYVLDVRTPRNIPPKLHANRWTGPWKVVQVISSCVYRVQKDGARKAIIVNIDRLAPYIVPDVQRFPIAEDETSNGDITEQEHVDTPLAMAEADDNEARVESDHAPQEEEESVHEPRVTRRAQRRRRPPARFNDYVINNDNDDDSN